MFAWIHSKKTKHPLEDFTDAREALAQLPQGDFNGTLQRLSEYLDAVKTSSDMSIWRAFEIVDLVDRTGRPHFRRASTQFLQAGPELTKFQATRAWTVVGEYLVQLAEAYQFCLATYESGADGALALRSQAVRIVGRALRARAAAIHWDYVRYTRHFSAWADLYRLYQLAEIRGQVDEKVLLYRGGQLSTLKQEFAAALMLEMCAPQSLQPVQIDIAHRVAYHLGREFVIGSDTKARLPFYFDPASDTSPARVRPNSALPGTARRFGVGAAEARLREITEQAQRCALNLASFGLGGTPDATMQATTEHLLKHWCAPPTERRHTRARRAASIRVLHGFQEVAANLGSNLLTYPFVCHEESWLITNRSPTGAGAIIAHPNGSWLHVGSLIAYREPENNAWIAAIVRHIRAEDGITRYAGLELLGGGAVAAMVSREGSCEEALALWLPHSEGKSDAISLLLPAGWHADGAPVRMTVYDRQYTLTPIRLQETGSDYQMVRFRVQGQAEVGTTSGAER